MSGHSRCLPARLGVWAALSIAFQALAGCSLPGEVRWAGGGPLPGATENLGKLTGSIEVIQRSGQPDGLPSSKPRSSAAAIEGEVVVGFDSPDGLPLRLEGASTKRFATKEVLRLDSGVALVQLPDGMAMDEAIAILARQPGVRSVVRNYKLSTSELPVSDDPLITDQWAFGPDAADILGAWKAIEAGSASAIASTTVAVIDTGVDPTHPDLNVLPGFNSFDPVAGGLASTASFDSAANFHGTAVAGIIGARKDNSIGSAGVLPGVAILPIRAAGDFGEITLFSMLRGLELAGYYNRSDSPYSNLGSPSGEKVRVVNLSLATAFGARLAILDEAMEFLWNRGVVVCVAAGNGDPGRRVGAPATSPAAIAVSATARRLLWEELAPFSGRGEEIWVSAPGQGLWTTATRTGGDYSRAYRSFAGTSAASAVASGVAAAINAIHGSGGPDQESGTWSARVKAHIASTADDLGAPGFDPLFGHGRVNARRAVIEVPSAP